jgi:hypothetical protein
VQQLDNSDLSIGESNSIVFPRAELHQFCQGLIDLSHIITSLYTTVLPPTLATWWTRYIYPYSRKKLLEKEIFVRQLISNSIQRVQEKDQAKIKSGLDHMVWRE